MTREQFDKASDLKRRIKIAENLRGQMRHNDVVLSVKTQHDMIEINLANISREFNDAVCGELLYHLEMELIKLNKKFEEL